MQHLEKDRVIIFIDHANIERQEEQEYSTLMLIKNLREELQKKPKTLAKIFPERVLKYTNKDLSIFWGYNYRYITTIKGRIQRGKNPDFIFQLEGLDLLREKLVDKLGTNTKCVINLIKTYEYGELTTLEFIDQLKSELGRVSGDIKVSKGELSNLFGKSWNFFTKIIKSLEDPNNNRVKQGYKFSIEILNDLRRNLEVDIFSFRSTLDLIGEFEKLNPEIPETTRLQHTISNVYAFKDIFNIEAAYWFGFLSADGHVSSRGDNMISVKLALADEESVQRFADFVGFDRNRIAPPKITYKRNSKGEIKAYKSVVVQFRSKIMNERLRELGIYGSKSERKNIPGWVIKAVKKAKNEAFDKEIHWSQTKNGKIAHSWLLGFFDGDGHHYGGNSATVDASNEQLILAIKDLFESPNPVRTTLEPETKVIVFGKETIAIGLWSLTLGPELFKRMLFSYKHSMDRKRP